MLIVICWSATVGHPFILLGQEKISTDDKCIPVQADTVVQRDTWFGKDKGYHVMGSFLIVCTGTWMHDQAYDRDFGKDIRFGAGLALSLGLTKELIDKYVRNRYFSGKDNRFC